MKLTAYAFHDAKVGVFHPPFFFLHRGQALRAAMELANDPNTTMGRHPADFHLFEVGIFDDQTGACEAVTPVALGPLSQFVEVKPAGAGPLFDASRGFVPARDAAEVN